VKRQARSQSKRLERGGKKRKYGLSESPGFGNEK
jgi:hypothetical protein